jgi:hypothetical protein
MQRMALTTAHLRSIFKIKIKTVEGLFRPKTISGKTFSSIS